MIEDDRSWYTVASDKTEAEAFRTGILESAHFIERNYGTSFQDALVLLTMTVELHCSRTGNWGKLEPTVCVGFPKTTVEGGTTSSHLSDLGD